MSRKRKNKQKHFSHTKNLNNEIILPPHKNEVKKRLVAEPRSKILFVTPFLRIAGLIIVISLLSFLVFLPKKNSVLGTSDKVPYMEENNFLPPTPEISAKSAIVVSTKKNKVYFRKNENLKLPPASTTKILTSLLAINEFNLSESAVVPKKCTQIDSSKIGLLSGERISVESLLYGTLVASAGDAACTLASYKLPESQFVAKMNLLAQKLNLKNTNFSNAIGLDYDTGVQESSAFDLYLMAKEAMKNGVFRKIVGTKEIIIYSSDNKFSHKVTSTNELLFEVPGTIGIKTGRTEKAKEVLVYSYSYKDDEIIIVVMGSDDRFLDAKVLLDYTLKNYAVL